MENLHLQLMVIVLAQLSIQQQKGSSALRKSYLPQVDITAGTKKTLEIKIGFFMTLSSTKSEISMI